MTTRNTIHSNVIELSHIRNESLLTEYQDENCWLCWRYEENDDAEKPRKVPVDPRTERIADGTDPAVWTDYNTAQTCYEQDKSDISGLGVALGFDDLVGVDLNNCCDPKTGDVEEWARYVVETLDSYALSKLREERTELQDEIQRLKRERKEIEAARDRLEERQETLETRVEAVETSVETNDTEGIEGEAAVTATVARLLEMDYLGRFDIAMSEANEIETGDAAFEPPADYWDGRSERRSSRARLGRLLDSGQDPGRYPTNGAARYEITESRYLGLSRDTRMIIEAQVYGHLEAYSTNEFDARPADLDDLLSIVNEAVHEAESGEVTYLLGIASPTGWTDRVRQQIQDEEFARTRFSQHVSLCLTDLQEGTVVYDESDPVAAENASLFEPPVDAERIRDCVETIRTEYVDAPLEQTVLLRDVAAEHDYDAHVVKRAFNRLEHDGVGEQFFVDDLGVTLEVGE